MDTVQIARPFIVHKLKTTPPVEKEADWLNLLEKFYAFSLPKSYSAKPLAVELAKRTRFLKDQILIELEREESEKKPGFTLGFYEAFQKFLIGSLAKDDFADLYAQTITYGLFAARTRAKNGFNRKLAYDFIPSTIGILRDVFKFVSFEDLSPQMEWIVDDISEVLGVADTDKILKERKGRDPIVHFYEPFLAEYDPKERERRGVYYTPEPVVSYIVRSLHRILKEDFDRSDGFASTTVRVLDPAAGTCTFPAEAARQAMAEFIQKYGAGGKEALIPDHILKNFYAFELMMAPYAVGHLKIGYLLEEFGHPLQKDERFQLYLTNTLDMQELQETKLPGMSSLAEESHLAGIVKKETPILVILGNPPYSGHSANVAWKMEVRREGFRDVNRKVFTFIGQLIEDYKLVDGKPLGERKPKWLQDDYVKFIRFAQWKIDQAGEGVLGFITNHSYLDNPTFRGMRQSLMNTFEQIYLLDLHGNSLKKERCPDGSKDENVFDIRQGVAIGLFVKKPGLKRKICHAEIWGVREKKYSWLEDNEVSATKWAEIHPKSPFYLFVPRDEALLDRYEQYLKVTEIFPVNSLGFQTHRDTFVIDFDRQVLERRIRTFRDLNIPDELVRRAFGLKDNRDWKMAEKRKKIQEDKKWEKKITRCLYRPFDIRWIFYHSDAIDFGRQELMRHMMAGDNLCLLVPRQTGTTEWSHVTVSDQIAESCVVSNKTREQNYNFPLYLHPESSKKNLFSELGPSGERKPNLSPKVLDDLKDLYGQIRLPEGIFYYIYAVLNAPSYSTQYAEFLKTDFPRIPFTKNQELFVKLGQLGKKLIDFQLLKSSELDKPICRFQGKGDNRVEKQVYNQKEKRVYINEGQYFEGLEPEVWDYQIGGYQVLDKWLKDRKKRILNLDDIKHYCRVVTALAKTIDIQAKIDALYPEVERETLAISHA